MNGKFLFSVFAATWGSAFQHGFHSGFINIPEKVFFSWYLQIKFGRHHPIVSIDEWKVMWSSIVSSFAIGGIVGGLLIALFANSLGRKFGLLCTNGLMFIGLTLMSFSVLTKSFEMFIVGRLLIGICAGLSSGLCPMYLIEISPDEVRGAVGSFYQFCVTFAIFSAQILSLPVMLGSDRFWPLAISLAIFPSLIQVFTLPFCPESPKYLFITKDDEDEAEEALTDLRGTWDIDEELDELREEKSVLTELQPVTFSRIFSDQTLRSPMIISTVIMMAQQFCGFNSVIYFSTFMIEQLRFKRDTAVYCTLGMGGLLFGLTLFSFCIVERAGRKVLLLLSLAGMSFITVVLTIAFQISFENEIMGEVVSYVAIVFLYLFVVMFALGAGTVPWFITQELSNHNARPLTTAIAVTFNWICNFILSQAFLPLQDLMGYYIFIPFVVFDIFFLIFISMTLRETMGESAVDMIEMFYD